jgi:tripartite-type tricarboxylate transporter receptor subunit TctC
MSLVRPLAVLLLLLVAGPAFAQSYPNRPLRLIIPMAAGGATDIVIRTIAPRMSELLGQQIIVDNRPGANESGVPGFEATAWFGMWMPAKTPRVIVTRVYDVVMRSLNDTRPAVEKLGYRIGGESPQEFAKFVRSEVEKFTRVVKSAGIKPEG